MTKMLPQIAPQITYRLNNIIGFNENKLGWAAANSLMKRFYQCTVEDGHTNIVLDLSNVKIIYPNGIVPIISEVDRLRRNGISFTIVPPKDRETRSYTERLGWIQCLSDTDYKPQTYGGCHNYLHKFTDADELNCCINDALDVCVKQLAFASGALPAFEWVFFASEKCMYLQRKN